MYVNQENMPMWTQNQHVQIVQQERIVGQQNAQSVQHVQEIIIWMEINVHHVMKNVKKGNVITPEEHVQNVTRDFIEIPSRITNRVKHVIVIVYQENVKESMDIVKYVKIIIMSDQIIHGNAHHVMHNAQKDHVMEQQENVVSVKKDGIRIKKNHIENV